MGQENGITGGPVDDIGGSKGANLAADGRLELLLEVSRHLHPLCQRHKSIDGLSLDRVREPHDSRLAAKLI